MAKVLMSTHNTPCHEHNVWRKCHLWASQGPHRAHGMRFTAHGRHCDITQIAGTDRKKSGTSSEVAWTLGQ
jgi:hypothetical protein